MNANTAEDARADEDDLRAEAHYLHGLFFKGSLDDEVADRYARAHPLCFPDDPEALKGPAAVFERRLDAEAVEYVQRLHRRSPVLTRKIRMLFYLLEVRSRYYGDFVARRSSRLREWLGILGGLLYSGVKYLKGWYLVWRHDLA